MTKKTSFVLSFLVFAVLSGSAYAVENYATEDYVDDQFAEVVGHVNKQDRSIRTEMKTNNDQLFANLVLLRDMLNARDADKNWIKLDTEAQLAIPAINELKAALDAKANADDVLTADSLTPLNEAITALQTGKADASTVTDIQTAIDNLGNTYATDAEVNAAIANVQSAIDNMDLSAYAKTADLAAVAISGQYADLEGKPEIPSIVGLATSEELSNLQTALEAAIAEKQAKGDYLVAADLNDLNDAVSALQSGKADASTVTNIQETINTLGDTYAAKSDLTAAEERLQAAITNIDLTPYAKTADLAKVATTGQYADLEGKPEIPSIVGLATSTELTNLQTALEAAIAEKQAKGDYLVAADLNDLNAAVSALQSGKADASTVTNIQETINKLGDTYAAKSDLTAAEERLQAAITNIDLTPYAKTADVEASLLLKEDAANKLTVATAEQIEGMSSEEKAKKFPSVSVAQTIANAAVTKVNEVAGDLSTLQTQVGTNAADIAEIKGAGYQTAGDVEAVLTDYAKTGDLGALAFKDKVATAEIENAAVTTEKIAGQAPADGETMFMSVNADGDAEWVSVKIY